MTEQFVGCHGTTAQFFSQRKLELPENAAEHDLSNQLSH
jgi:hypothetical protein